VYRKGHVGASLVVYAPFGFVVTALSSAGTGVVGAVVVWLDALPNVYGLAPPILTTVLLAGLVGLTGPDES
jgi:inner membrane protein